ncbi:MAG: Yip1 family protein [Alphaproteobacteria bacterium]|nr:Yip1 family protein [Alphaproteobacteria bacterium]
MSKKTFDIKSIAQETASLCMNMVKSPFQTIDSHIQNITPWKETTLHKALPLFVAIAVLLALINIVTGAEFSIVATIFEPIFTIASILLLAFIFSIMAPRLGGEKDLDKAFMITFLTCVPIAVASLFAFLGMIYGIIALPLLGYTVFLLYKTLPENLGVTELPKKVVLIVAGIAITMCICIVLSPLMPQQPVPSALNTMPQNHIPN